MSESANITRLREQYPHVSPGFFDLLAEREEINRELSDLRCTIAGLAGRYGYAAKVSSNTDLAALVVELCAAVGLDPED